MSYFLEARRAVQHWRSSDAHLYTRASGGSKRGPHHGLPVHHRLLGHHGHPCTCWGLQTNTESARAGRGKESSVAKETHHPKCCSWLWDRWSTSCCRNSTCWRHSSRLKKKKGKKAQKSNSNHLETTQSLQHSQSCSGK